MHVLRRPCFNQPLGLVPVREAPFFYLPGDGTTYIREVDASMQSLEAQIFAQRTTLPVDFVRDWYALSGEWRAWKDAHSSTWSLIPVAVWTRLRGFSTRYNAFERRFESLTGREGGVPDVLTPEEEETGESPTSNAPLILWAALGVAGVFGLGYLTWAIVRGVQTTGFKFRVR